MVGINIKAITFQVSLMKRETKNRFLAVAVRISGKITKRRAQIAYNHEEEKAFQSNQPPAPTVFFLCAVVLGIRPFWLVLPIGGPVLPGRVLPIP